VDAVVRKWYPDVMEDMTSAVTGLEGDAIRDRASLFCTDDGAIGSRDPEWLQIATQHLCDLFRNCTGLKPNTNKTEVMICHPGEIRDRCSMEGINATMRLQEIIVANAGAPEWSATFARKISRQAPCNPTYVLYMECMELVQLLLTQLH